MWTEPILHVDMDSFFVEVERLADPSLRGIPVAVGGTGPRSVIASASYEARSFGVHSAQPTTIALRACPRLVIVPPSHGKYGAVSEKAFALFRTFTPMVEGLSLDEAYLDISGLRLHHSSPVSVGEALRSRIKGELGLPASVGLASSKLIAKLASEAAKPDGLRHVPFADQTSFLSPLPAGALPGIGPATLAALERLGVVTVGDIAELSAPALSAAVGPAMGLTLSRLASGIDDRPIKPDMEAKSVSVEETFDQDLVGKEVLNTAILALAHRLASRLRRSGLAGRTVTLKVRYPDFETITRSRSGASATDSWRDVHRVGTELLEGLDSSRGVRLLGLGVSGIEEADEPRQLGIGSSADWERVEDAVAEVRGRFGERAVAPARLIDEPYQEPGQL